MLVRARFSRPAPGGTALGLLVAVALALGPALPEGAVPAAGAHALEAQAPPSQRRRDAARAIVDGEYRHELAPTATAVRAVGPIEVDGRLDDPTWAEATPITDFIQEIPLEGEPASRRTEVRIAFDDDAVYVGAMLYDDGSVTGRLQRRDGGGGDFDYLGVSLDSFHDHETTFNFFVNPAGSYQDMALGGGGGGGDGGGGGTSWNPVWSRAARVTDEGWSAELRIPFSQLRFSGEERQVWGIRVTRNVYRLQERAVFPFIPVLERGGASRYGHLEGIEGIDPGRSLELLPYVAARGEYLRLPAPAGVGFANPYRDGSDHFGGVGLDLKYRLTPNVTLDATVNPDFGQVELDPSVINLTAFETRYAEVRPFFVEGADIFTFGEGGPAGSSGRPPQLLYSRRIGRSPQGSVPSSAVFSDADAATTILGAAKVTGRTTSGWSLGLLEALTGKETAEFVDAGRARGEAVVEPTSNYLIARARKQTRGGDTRFGLIASAVNRALSGTEVEDRLHAAAYSGGFDAAHEWDNRTYRVSGSFTASYVRGSALALARTQRSSTRYYQRPDASHLELDPGATSLAGYYAMVDVAKQAGAFGANLALALSSPGYEVNDLGFQTLTDRLIVDANFRFSRPNPGRIFRSWTVRASPDASWNYAGDRVHTELGAGANVQLLNYWSAGAGLAYRPAVADDRLTRGGPMARTPTRYGGSVNVGSDSRRSVVGRLAYAWDTDDSGGWGHDVSLSLTANPSDWVRVQTGPRLSRRLGTGQYVSSVPDPLAARTYGRRYVFADLEQTTLSLSARLNVTLTTDLSLQLYAEPFISAGDYRGLKELARPRAYEFLRYGADTGTVSEQPTGQYAVDPDGAGPAAPFAVPNRDFSYRSLLGNAVLRWEWREGSTLYLVWQQRRIDSRTGLGPIGTADWIGTFDLARDVGDMFRTPSDNIFAIKINYWLNP